MRKQERTVFHQIMTLMRSICLIADKAASSFLQLKARFRSQGHGYLHAGFINIVPYASLSDQCQIKVTVGANNACMEAQP